MQVWFCIQLIVAERVS